MRLVVRLGFGLLLLAIVVSLIGLFEAPAVDLGTIPDSAPAVTEITGLYPVTVNRVVTPRTVEEISKAVAASPGPIAIGGGRYSMGGQTATLDGTQLDLRQFHGIVNLDTAARTITVTSSFFICRFLSVEAL